MKKCLLSIFIWLCLFSFVSAETVLLNPTYTEGYVKSHANVVANSVSKSALDDDSFMHNNIPYIPHMDIASSAATVTYRDAIATNQSYGYYTNTMGLSAVSKAKILTDVYNDAVVDGVSGSSANAYGEAYFVNKGTYINNTSDNSIEGTFSFVFLPVYYAGFQNANFECTIYMQCDSSYLTIIWNPAGNFWAVIGTLLDENNVPQSVLDIKYGESLDLNKTFYAFVTSSNWEITVDFNLLSPASNTPSLGVTHQDERVSTITSITFLTE